MTDGSAPITPSPRRRWVLGGRPWFVGLGLVTAVGLIVRIVAVASGSRTLVGDGIVFDLQANLLADGRGFLDAGRLAFTSVVRPSAQHPPLFPLVLAGVSWLGFRSVLAHQMAAAFMSAAAVPLVSLAAREAAGRRAGFLAAAIAAVYPNLWASDVGVMSESLYVTTIALSLWMLLRLWRLPSLSRAVWAGAAIGLAALTRAEAVFLLPLAVAPPCLRAPAIAMRRRIAVTAAAFAVAAALISPWVIRNVVTFDRLALLSTNADSVIAGANCDDVYYGPRTGSWTLCNGEHLPKGDETVEGAVLRARGIRYARAHRSRVPVVVAARVGRAFDLYRPSQGLLDFRSRWTRYVAVGLSWIVMVLALPGALELRRRKVTLVPFVAFVVLTTFVAVTGYGLWRLRLPVDVAAIALTGVTLANWRRSPTAELGGGMP